jgi:hypothetical protein
MWCEGKKILKTVTGVAAAAVLAAMFTTCNAQVGLGEQVDTEVPTVAISYPPESAIIRQSFVLSGVCNDDTAVTKVSVQITNTTTNAVWGPYAAEVSSKTWKVTLNPSVTSVTYNGWTLPDGNYSVSVTAYDNAGRSSGTASHAYFIDNTAPIFIIKGPGVSSDAYKAGTATATEFGAKFKITGTIAESNTVKTMNVTVYNTDGTVVNSTDTNPYTFSNVETAGGTTVTIAQHSNTLTGDVYDHYNEMYGSSSGNKYFFCKVNLIDNAKVYQNPDESSNTSTGNETGGNVYLYDGIYNSLMSSSSSYNLEASEILKIYNNTYNTKTVDRDAVLSLLNASGTKVTQTAFVLNPDASAKYSVSGLKFNSTDNVTSNDDANKLYYLCNNSSTSNTTVTVSVQAGRDGTYIKPASLTVYQFGPWTDLTNVKNAYGDVFADPADYASKNSTISSVLGSNSSYTGSTVDSYTYTTSTGSSVAANKYYLIAVTGEDADGVDATPSDGYYYGFKGSSNTNPPKVEFGATDASAANNIANLTCFNTSAMNFSGTVTSSSGTTIQEVRWEAIVTDENTSTVIGTIGGSATGTNSWSFNLTNASAGTVTMQSQSVTTKAYSVVAAAANSGKQYQFDVLVEATDVNNATSTVAERIIHVDTTAPEVTISSLTPIVSKSVTSGSTTTYTSYINGTIKLSGTVSELYMKDLSYQIYVDGAASGSSVSLGTKTSFSNIEIDTTAFTDGKPFDIVFTATDKAGNTGTYSTHQYNKAAYSSYTLSSEYLQILQSTDAPTISFTNANDALDTVAAITNAVSSGASQTNIFGSSTNNKLIATIADDDGIQTIEIGYIAANGTTTEARLASNTSTITVGGSTTYPLTYILPTGEGAWDVAIKVTDTAGKTTGTTTNGLTVMVDQSAPTTTLATSATFYDTDGNTASTVSSGKSYVSKTGFTLSGSIIEANFSSASIAVTKDGVSDGTAFKTGGTSAGAWTYVQAATDGKYVYTITIKDKAGNETVAAVTIIVDTMGPVIKINNTELSAGSTSKITSTSANYARSGSVGSYTYTYKLSGSLSDAGCGAKKFFYSTDSATIGSGTWKEVDSTEISEQLTVAASLSETIALYAQDIVGNNSAVVSYPVIFDYDPPVVTITTPSTSATANAAYAISGTVTETNLSSLVITYTFNGIDKGTLKSLTAADYASSTAKTWAYTLPAESQNGTYVFTMTATDDAGQTAKATSASLVFDTNKPTITYISTTSCIVKNVPQEFSGTTSDNIGVTNVYYYVSATSAVPTYGTGSWYAASVNSETAWSATVNLSAQTSDTVYIFFAAKDAAGNVAVTTGYATVILDSATPVLSFTSPAADTQSKADVTVSGTITEKNIAAAAITYTFNGTDKGTWYTFTSADITSLSTGSSVSWSETLPKTETAGTLNTQGDGTYVFTLTVTDKAGQSATVTSKSIVIDTTKPVIAVTNLPASAAVYGDFGSYKSYLDTSAGTYSLRGTWKDMASGTNGGTGTDTLSYSWDGSTYKAFTGTASVTAEKSFTVDLPVSQGNGQTLYLKATDAVGNESAITTITGLTFDYAAPVVTFTTPAVYTKNGGTLTVTATVTDTYKVTAGSDITMTATRNGSEATPTTKASVQQTTGTAAENAQTVNCTFTVSGITANDGSWAFTIAGKDGSGRTTTAITTTSCIVDATAPAMTSIIVGSKDYTTAYYSDSALKVTGSIEEMVSATIGSGVDTIAYKVYNGTDNNATYLASSGSFSAGSASAASPYYTSCESTISGFTAGTNYLHLQPTDKAGNTGTDAMYIINVDQTSPTLVSSNPSGSQNTNALAAMTVTGVAADDIGVAKVELLVGGKTTTRTSGTPVYTETVSNLKRYIWSVTLPVADLSGADGQAVACTITDVAGNSTKLTAFTLKVDDKAPTATISSSVSSLNGTLDIKGTTDDGSNTPASMRLYYSTKKSGTYSGTLDFAGGSTTTASDSPAKYGWTAVPTTAGGTTYQYTDTANVLSWKYTGFDFSTLSGASSASDGKATMYLLPVVVDAAGNCNAYTMAYDEASGKTTYTWTLSAAAVTCTVDMNSDRPQIKTTNLSSDGILKYGTKATINGTVNDDDSTSSKIVTAFIACESQITAVTDNGTGTYTCTIGGSTYPFTYASSTDAGGNSVITVTSPSATTTSGTKYGITTYTPATGAWTFMPSDVNDGPHTMYFYVIDNNGTVFYTNKSGSSSVLYDPYITLNGGTQTNNTAVISYNSDSNAPAVGEIKVAYCSTSAGDYTDYASFSAGSIMGGTVKKYAKFLVTASDANGIKSVQLTLTDSASATKTSGSTFSGTPTITSSGGDFVISGNKTTTSATSAWTTSAIDLSQFTTGLVSVIAKPTDNSDMYGNGTNSFYNDYKVDMSSFKVSSPSADSSGVSNDIMTSDVTVSGIAGDGSGAGISTIKWMVPATGVTAANVTASPSSYAWQGNLYSGSTATAWQFLFDADGDANAATDANNPQLTAFTKVYSSYAITKGTGVKESVYYIPIYFELTDALGNVGVYTGYTMQYNPNANWPTAKIVYPTTGSTVGNTIRVTGSATDNNSVSAVYVQIGFGTSTSDVTWVRADTQGLISSCVSGGDFTVTSASDSGIVTETNGSSSAYGDGTSWWGIKVTNTTSWYLVLNKSKVLNTVATKYKTGSTNGKMFLRTCAVDNESLCGLWSSVVALDVDTGVPEISEPYLAQFSGATPSSAAQTAYKPYSVDMYVTNTTGQWYLVAKAADDGSIKDYTITQAQGGSAATDYTSSCTAEALTYTDTITYTGYTFYIPVTTTKEGTLTYVIDTIDNDDKESKYTCTFTVDTTAPALGTLEAESGNLKISTSTQVAGNKLVNSDGAVTLESSIVDATSGFSRFAYYFVRNSTVYNAIPGGSSSGWTMAAATGYAQSGLTKKDSMYGLEADGGTISGVTYTSASVSGNANIRAGGIAKINGVYYRIASVSGSAVTLEADSLSSVSSGNTAFFPYALSLRYKSGSSSEYYATGSGSSTYTISGDDDDGIVETTTKSGTKYTWNLSVLSGAFDDGPISIVLVAFDNAGNISMQTVNTMIANKTPRLSKVFLGTDLNSDGSFANDEFAYTTAVNGADTTNYSYSALDTANGNIGKEYVNLTTTNTNAAGTAIKFSARDKLAVTMEFIDGEGGQGTVSYIAKLASAAATAPATGTVTGSLGTVSTISDSTKITNTGILFGNTDITGLSGYAASMENNSSGGVTNLATQTYLQLSLWDQSTGAAGGTADTTGTVDGTSGMVSTYGNQFTVLNVPFYLDIADDQNPTVTLDNLTKDSAYTVTTSGTTTVYGHVEQGTYLPTDNFKAATTSGEMDRDDKISGKVVFTGALHDNMHIGSIYLEAANTTAAASPTQSISGLLGAAGTSYRVLVASYDTTTGSATKGTLVFDTKYTKANFAAGTYNFYFIKTGETFTQANGHVVTFEMGVDTSKVSSVAANDIIFDVYTVDGNSLAGEKTKQCDIVPYITNEITRNSTSISAGKLNRSSYGRYAVVEGETLTVKGYNLSTAPIVTVNTTGVTPDSATGTSFTFVVPSNSGELTVTVNNIKTLNNMNANNSTTTNNLESGTSAVNTWYDDRYLSTWNLGNYFKSTDGGVELQQPVMTADASGNLVASWAAQSNSQIMFSYGISQNTTAIFRCYDQPSNYTSVAFDRKGASSGASVLFIPEHQGSGGTFSNYAMSSAFMIGGAAAVQIDSTFLGAKNVLSGQTVEVTNNPINTLDNTNNTAYYNLANYDMSRRLGSFEKPRNARWGNYLHNVWYDNVTEGLKYSVVNTSDESNYDTNAAAIVGWVVLDGGYTGQDRVYDFNTTAGKTLNTLGSVNKGHPTTTGTGNKAAYSKVIFATGTGAVGATSLNIGSVDVANAPQAGDTVALLKNTSGDYAISLRTITNYSGGYIYWTGAVTHTIANATIYEGNMNLVGADSPVRNINDLAITDPSTSAGSSSDIDVETDGKPVVAYYDAAHSSLRIAKASVVNPTLASNWTRIIPTGISCAGEVSMRLDKGNNIHIMYKDADSQMCYLYGALNTDGDGYNFDSPEVIDTTGALQYGELSVIENGTTYTPCVTYLNSAGTASGIKYAVRRKVTINGTTSDVWDYQILPSLGTGHYAVAENRVCLEARKAGWTGTTTTVLNNGGATATATPATVDAVVAFKSKQYETAYLKSESSY